MKTALILGLFFLFSCSQTSSSQRVDHTITHKILNPKGETIEDRFAAPEGYSRTKNGGFGDYLRSLPLKKHGSQVHLYNGALKNRQDVHAAVINIEVGNKDLQQCADAVMRLRAEYLFSVKGYDRIHFNFTNGFRADYNKWRTGYRIKLSGNNVKWVKTASVDTSHTNFKEYLERVYMFAGTLSLSKELRSVPFKEMKIGDVLIQGGSPGHAVIVVDVATNAKGENMFMLAQSYMPAQEIHVLKNVNNSNISPWYDATVIHNTIQTPEWEFTVNDLKRFD